ncbi:MAG: hypothetical protein RL094_269 [Candidatus Parcubacteria bacterium]|jgi:hypothetical protein
MNYVQISDDRIAEITEKAAAVGARIYVIRKVCIQQDRDWKDSITQGAPDTPPKYSIFTRQVSDSYVPVSTETVEKDIILFLDPNEVRLENVTVFAERSSLKVANPREVFALCEHQAELASVIEWSGVQQRYIRLVAPVPFQAEAGTFMCAVGVTPRSRIATVDWAVNFNLEGDIYALCE